MATIKKNPLTELIPAKYRKYVYYVAAGALFVYSLWEASEGNIETFVVSIVTSAVAGLAGANTSDPVVITRADVENVIDEDNFVDGHGDDLYGEGDVRY